MGDKNQDIVENNVPNDNKEILSCNNLQSKLQLLDDDMDNTENEKQIQNANSDTQPPCKIFHVDQIDPIEGFPLTGFHF